MFVKKIFIAMSLAFAITLLGERTEQLIVLFIKPLPSPQQHKPFKPSLFHPGRIHKKMVNKMLDHQKRPFVFAFYGGNIGLTDENGEITFPRRTQKPKLDIVVTQDPEPHFQAGLTNILFWRVPPTSPASRTTLTREQDPGTNLVYWNAKPSQLAKTQIIPPHSIVILAKPKNIYIPEGITLSSDSPHFILPTIYVKPTIDPIEDSLFAMNKSLFFKPIRKMYKIDKTIVSEQLDPTYKGISNEATNSL